jgi:benzoyl-CoA-dihydrodiol lyase
LVDKRPVRRDVADLFCTKAEGFRARDAVKYRLVDGSFPRSKWEAGVAARAAEVAASSPARATEGIELSPVLSEVGEDGSRTYTHVTLELDPDERVATLTVQAPQTPAPADAAALRAEGASTWSMAAFRELEDALFHLRFTHETYGLILLKTRGDAAAILAHDKALADLGDDWLATEIRLLQARILRRVDNTARSFFAIIDPGSCFAGSLMELALAADRSYMLEDDDGEVTVTVSEAQGGAFPMSTGLSRLQARFPRDPASVEKVLAERGEALDAPSAFDLGLVTVAPDDIDWEDELRIAVEERASLSPDALTGMEQNLRFVGRETCDSKIFGRLSAWQNWIFQRPNAVGDEGALTLYGHPTRPSFDFRRT